MTGVGTAAGAGTIVNAFATGHGAAFGLAFRVQATVDDARQWGVTSNRKRLNAADSRLALEAARLTLKTAKAGGPLRITIESDIPPKKGLKSSSAVGVAVARAVLSHAGRSLPPRHLLALVGEAGLRSRTSLTGAFDDAAACLLGGVVFADNAKRSVIAQDQLPGDLTALVHIPKASTATGSLRRRDFRDLAPLIDEAWKLGRAGRYKEAMLVNTLAYAPRLGVRPLFTLRALEAGAYAAGLSGKGPAEVALVHEDEVARFFALAKTCRTVPLFRRDAAWP